MSTIWEDDIAQAEQEPGLAETLTWDGKPYPCVFQDQGTGFAGTGLGLVDVADAQACVRASLFTLRKPRRGDTVTYRGRSYTVMTFPEDPTNASIVMTLKQAGA